ncbi:hypothetical protein AB3X82_12255 [Paraburkholderia phenoliruptrix]|uniref:Uncharacterized protein n=1 Tax=Paraburkholderia phenoliruptrix TaxID=252970 RepID=A0ABV3WBJ5_9BURK
MESAQLVATGTGYPVEYECADLGQLSRGIWTGRQSRARNDCPRLGLRAVLVRPDGFVAWACEHVPDDKQVARALSQWFGQPGGPDRVCLSDKT